MTLPVFQSPNLFLLPDFQNPPCIHYAMSFFTLCLKPSSNDPIVRRPGLSNGIYFSPVACTVAVETVNFLIYFKPKLHKYPKDNFGLKKIRKFI